jgi:hypothetical protein
MSLQDQLALVAKQFPGVVTWITRLDRELKELKTEVAELKKAQRVSAVVSNPPYNTTRNEQPSVKLKEKVKEQVVNNVKDDAVVAVVEVLDTPTIDVKIENVETKSQPASTKKVDELVETPKELVDLISEVITTEETETETKPLNNRKNRKG